MSGTPSGAIRTAASKADCTEAGYRSMVSAGMKWCTRCKAWHDRCRFGIDVSRYDGLSSRCLVGRVFIHPEVKRARCNEAARRRYAVNPGPARQRAHARKRGVEPIPAEGLDALQEWWGGRCAYCGRSATTYDHVFPVSAGGQTRRSNIVPACVSCNSSKGARDPWPWVERGSVLFPEEWEEMIALTFQAEGGVSFADEY